MKAKHIFGTITIVAIIGGTIYAIKKSKDLKKSEGEAISLEEAKAIVAQMDRVSPEAKVSNEQIWEEIKAERDKQHKEVQEGTVMAYKSSDEIDEEEEDEDEYPEVDETTDGPLIDESNSEYRTTMVEEAEDLRYHPDSVEARTQYIEMELAEWLPNDPNREILLRLFDFPFEPRNDGDHILKTQIIDFKVQFFGFESRWSKEVSIADIILHYSRAAQFNTGESVMYWAEYFIDFSEIDVNTSSRHIDEWIAALNSHTYFNKERATFGLFGLTSESMEQAISIANGNIDSSVTYEIEFNEFLKSCF